MEKRERNPMTNLKGNLSGLGALAIFLDLDFDSPNPEVLEKLEAEVKRHPLSQAYMINDALKDVKKAKKVQSELQQILIPIIPPAKATTATEAYHRMQKLLEMINKLQRGLPTRWAVEPVRHDWAEIGDPEHPEFELRRKEPEEVEKTSSDLLSPYSRLNILGYEWFFGRDPGIREVSIGFTRENLYIIILDALESGEFSRLKRCQWKDCQVFFVAEPPSRKACTDEHATEVDRIEAGKRMTEGRKEEREANQRRSWPANERNACELLLKLMKQARKGKIDREELARRKSILGALDKWQKGTSLNEIWTGLPDDVKEAFRRRRQGQSPQETA